MNMMVNSNTENNERRLLPDSNILATDTGETKTRKYLLGHLYRYA
ncbi:hypothetical protein [Virgibacillus sp. MSJ-26]|nr:hypothetical protein [Virgibacillus sp. MSJ-26]